MAVTVLTENVRVTGKEKGLAISVFFTGLNARLAAPHKKRAGPECAKTRTRSLISQRGPFRVTVPFPHASVLSHLASSYLVEPTQNRLTHHSVVVVVVVVSSRRVRNNEQLIWLCRVYHSTATTTAQERISYLRSSRAVDAEEIQKLVCKHDHSTTRAWHL